jgi:hypothetical protein
MSFSRRRFLVGLVACALAVRLLPAQEAQDLASPVTFSKQFSADMIVTGEDGRAMRQKIFTDNDKVRMEMDAGIGPIMMIVRPDQGKVYSIMESQKTIMAMPFDPKTLEAQMAFATGLDRKYDNLGPETMEGVACTKYRFTSADRKVYYLWVDTARKIPVKMAAADRSFTLLFKNYQVGPQDAALFTLPTGYQTMELPSLPTLPGAPARP